MKFEKAKRYDEFAHAQKFAAQSLIKNLKIYGLSYKNIYEIGCGTGILTKLILDEFKFEKLILNDIYKTDFMSSDFSYQIGDIKELEIPTNLDLIISASVFQWFDKDDELKKLINKIYHSIKSGGKFAFCMFISGTLSELSSFTNQGLSYKSQKDILALLEKFDVLHIKTDQKSLKFNSLKELLNHLKQTGVNNLNGKFKLTKNSLKNLQDHFDGNFILTYNFIEVLCKKA